ncbi:MAG: hypothetical protein KAS71_14245 [Bacteroidales bacterium]|nr:hypothetical protein [Bacteroidales bacterium]
MTKKDNDIREKIIKGLDLTIRKLIKSKKERNLDFVISDKGKVIRLRAKDC